MAGDLLDMYGRASGWAIDKVRGAQDQLDAPTPCEDWDVRALLNHMLDTQRYFIAAGRGEHAPLPSPIPPQLLSADPVGDFENGRAAMLEVFGDPTVQQNAGLALGIAFSDQLLHGWDLARATSQDATMPDGCAQVAYDTIHGQFTDEQRQGVFKPAITVGADASPQAKLLAYTGREPG